MKAFRTVVLACILIVSSAVFPAYADALTPPGPPGSAAAAMKTLNQIEPRILIESLPTVISNSGSYYIMENLTLTQNTSGITIYCRDVHIDLGGYSLLGIGGGSCEAGIYVNGVYQNISVENGVIRNWGWEGIWGPNALECHVKGVSVVSNQWPGISLSAGALIEECVAIGNSNNGIQVGNNSTVQRCTSMYNAYDGLSTGGNVKIYDCTTMGNGNEGIDAGDAARVNGCTSSGNKTAGIDVGVASVVQSCVASGNTNNGIAAAKAVRVIECNARANNGDGISADDSSVVLDCISSYNGEDGIEVTSNCRVEENNCTGNGRLRTGAGIHATGSGNRIDNNNVSENSRGVLTDAAGSIVLRNTAYSNGTGQSDNYDLKDGTHYGRIALDINGQILTDQPWVNFSF